MRLFSLLTFLLYFGLFLKKGRKQKKNEVLTVSIYLYYIDVILFQLRIIFYFVVLSPLSVYYLPALSVFQLRLLFLDKGRRINRHIQLMTLCLWRLFILLPSKTLPVGLCFFIWFLYIRFLFIIIIITIIKKWKHCLFSGSLDVRRKTNIDSCHQVALPVHFLFFISVILNSLLFFPQTHHWFRS